MKWAPAALLPLLFCLWLPLVGLGQEKNVTIRVVQDDTVLTATELENSLTLEKRSFKIQVLLQNTKGVYLFASLKDSLFNLPDQTPVPGFINLPDMIMSEEVHNNEKELMVNDEGWSYWFYDPGLSWHRFNKKIIFLDSGRVVGTKTIKQLFFLPSRETKKIKENNATLYLFFVAVKEDASGRPVGELLRRKIKIDWRDEE